MLKAVVLTAGIQLQYVQLHTVNCLLYNGLIFIMLLSIKTSRCLVYKYWSESRLQEANKDLMLGITRTWGSEWRNEGRSDEFSLKNTSDNNNSDEISSVYIDTGISLPKLCYKHDGKHLPPLIPVCFLFLFWPEHSRGQRRVRRGLNPQIELEGIAEE